MSKSGYQKERMQEWFDWRTFDTAWILGSRWRLQWSPMQPTF